MWAGGNLFEHLISQSLAKFVGNFFRFALWLGAFHTQRLLTPSNNWILPREQDWRWNAFSFEQLSERPWMVWHSLHVNPFSNRKYNLCHCLTWLLGKWASLSKSTWGRSSKYWVCFRLNPSGMKLGALTLLMICTVQCDTERNPVATKLLSSHKIIQNPLRDPSKSYPYIGMLLAVSVLVLYADMMYGLAWNTTNKKQTCDFGPGLLRCLGPKLQPSLEDRKDLQMRQRILVAALLRVH